MGVARALHLEHLIDAVAIRATRKTGFLDASPFERRGKIAMNRNVTELFRRTRRRSLHALAVPGRCDDHLHRRFGKGTIGGHNSVKKKQRRYLCIFTADMGSVCKAVA